MTARLKRLVARRLGRLGWPGAVGIGVWAMAAAFHFSAVRPAQQHLDEVRFAAASLQQRIALAAFYRAFPDERTSPEWIGRIAATAERCGLSLDQGEYRPTRDSVGRLTRLQMTLPVRGEYRQIRRFLASTGTAVPIVSLEQVQFERQKVGDPQVDATIRLVLYLEQPS